MDTLDDVAKMPLLRIIQSGSPEVKKSHKDYPLKRIEGAEEGDILLASTGEIFKKLEIIPLAHVELYAEWRPKNIGGGFVQHHPLSIVGDKDYKKGSARSDYDEFLGENELIKTKYFAVLARVDEEWKNAVLAFSSTGLKPGRQLNNMIKTFHYPDRNCYRWEQLGKGGKHEKFVAVDPMIYSRSFWLTTEAKSNDDGDWYNWHIEPGHTFELSGENAQDDLATLELASTAQRAAVADLPEPEKRKALSDGSHTDVVADEDPY